MSNMTLKIGDKVRVRTTGKIGRVAAIRPPGDVYDVLIPGRRGPSSVTRDAMVYCQPDLERVSVPFVLRQGDKVVNLKTGREGIVLMGLVWDADVFSTSKAVPAKALEEYEEHYPGTYDLIKAPSPW